MHIKNSLDAIGCIIEQHDVRCGKSKVLEARRNRLRALIERHQAALDRTGKQLQKEWDSTNLHSPFRKSEFLQPVADAVLTHFPGMAAEILGPYGLGNTSSITIYDPAKDSRENAICWLQFRFNNESRVLSYVDLSQKVGDYPPNSLGDKNGLNYAEVAIAPDMALEELVSRFMPCSAKR